METKEYFEKVMQDFRSAMPLGSSKNQHRNGRSLRKYCQDEGIDYKWLQEYKRTYPNETKPFFAMLNFKSNITYYLSSTPTAMRKRSLDTIKWRKVQSDKFFKKSC
jgi:hypothetical protein